MLKRIGEILPSFISKELVPIYVYIRKITGKNYETYLVYGENLQFLFNSEEQFLMIDKMIDQGQIVAENIPLEYLQDIEKCDSFIDVGAYHGLYSLIVGKLYEDVDIYSFEPNKYNRQVLTQTLELNGINSNIRKEIVTNSSGEIKFYERPNPASQSHSTTEYDQSDEKMKNSISLSDLFIEEDINHPYVKLDAEGEEYNILRDISENKHFSSIRGIVEIHPEKMDVGTNEIIRIFKENEYEYERLGDTTGPDFESRPAFYFSS